MADNAFEMLRDALAQIAAEIVRLLPKLFIALIVVAITFSVIKVLNYSFRKMLRLVKLDETFKKLAGFSFPFSLDGLIIFLADLGIVLIALYAMANLFLGVEYLKLMNEGLYYGARIVSIIIIAIIILTIFSTVIGKVKVETRLRSYSLFIVLLLVTAMLIDITALSDQVKSALISGLAIGLGISVGVFAVWFFFHEYFDRILKKRDVELEKEEKEE
ncbi:MAG: hypothetical protein QXN87_08265 [Candidatus Bathyarchaeia archaeon]